MNKLEKVTKERDHYKNLYENLSKRISSLHKVASTIPDETKFMVINLKELRNKLKKIAFGQP